MAKKEKPSPANGLTLEEREHYRTLHDNLSRAISGNEDAFNNRVFYVSTGAILLSVTFLTDLFKPDENMHAIFLLIAAWIGFVGAILMNIVSYLKCVRRFAKKRAEIAIYIKKERNYQTRVDSEERTADREEEKKIMDGLDRMNKKVRCENWLTASFFFFGIVAFIVFVSINLINLK